MLNTKGHAALFAMTFLAEEAPETWPATRPGIEAHVIQLRQANGSRGASSNEGDRLSAEYRQTRPREHA
jgi:hypothetical protein